jgi:hypothetical protein
MKFSSIPGLMFRTTNAVDPVGADVADLLSAGDEQHVVSLQEPHESYGYDQYQMKNNSSRRYR